MQAKEVASDLIQSGDGFPRRTTTREGLSALDYVKNRIVEVMRTENNDERTEDAHFDNHQNEVGGSLQMNAIRSGTVPSLMLPVQKELDSDLRKKSEDTQVSHGKDETRPES